MYTEKDLLALYNDPVFYDIEFGNRDYDAMFYKDFCENFEGKILEIACGTGRIISKLSNKNSKLFGKDISKDMIEKAQNNYPNIHFEVEDMTQTKGNYDLVFCATNAFQHILNDQQATASLKSIKEALNSNGTFILDIQNPNLEKLNRDLAEPYKYKSFCYQEKEIDAYIHGNYNKNKEVYYFTIQYFYGEQKIKEKQVAMKMYAHNVIKQLIKEAGFIIEVCYGSYKKELYTKSSDKQVFILK